MINKNNVFKLMSWVGVLTVLICFFAASSHEAYAATAKAKINFDHVKTGFPLSGAHAQVPCETCHVQGTFKGTPKKCETCHSAGSRIQTTTVKPSNHIPTTDTCDTCHTSTSSWKVARFNHVGVTKNQCRTCHNNNIVEGKKSNHLPTNLPCDACHRTTTWTNTTFDHPGVAPGSCNQCHNGNMAGVTGKPSGHPITTASCDTCHTGFITFAGMAGGSFNHAGVTIHTCANSGCHTSGGSGMQKTNDHVPTNLACDYCHSSTTTFKSSSFSHSATQGISPSQCSSCHDGTHTSSNALGKTASPPHPVTTASCDSCHSGYVSFAMSTAAIHAKVTPGTCANSGCHTTGGSGKQKSSNHIPTQLSCDSCHNMTTFTPSSFVHSATQGVTAAQCASSGCHDGTHTSSNALGKTPSPPHPVTNASCDTCHTGYTSFAGADPHKGVVASMGTCANSGCHAAGGAGKQKTNDHVPTNLSCNACHNMTTFNPASFTHSPTQGVVGGQCASSGCHDGTHTSSNALGKTPSPPHPVTSASCDTCHSGYASFAGANAHAGVIASAGACATAGCHAPGGSGKQKANNHIPTSLSCNWCHNMTTFTPSSFTHSATQGVIAGQCASSGCHDGTHTSSNALGKTPSPPHPVTSASCDSCHSGYASFTGANNHAGVVQGGGTCAKSGCHSPGGSGMQKPNGHLPTTLSCDSCHNMVSFATNTFTHSAVQGVTPTNCTTCHNGSVKNALPLPGGHIPVGAAACSACHTATAASFNPSTFNHSATQNVLPGQCSTCHNGSYTGQPWNAQTKSSQHIPYESQLLAGASLGCDACHTSKTSWTTTRMNHNNSQGNGSGWCKGCHMSGTSFSANNMEKKSLTHQKSTGVTDCSQSGCHRPLGNRGSPYSSW